MMPFDLSTFTGVLGVVLTVLFFAIGYRQTIGGRKERARSANKQLAEALFRRLALDESFPINLSGVLKLIMGSALEARVRFEDLYGADQLEAVFYAKIVESDYLPDDRRVAVLTKLSQCFSGEDRRDYLQSTPSPQKSIGSEARLAIVSATMAGFLSMVIAGFISIRADNALFDGMASSTMIGAVAALSALLVVTGAVLAIYTRLRENSVSTMEQSVSSRRAAECEREILEQLIADGFKISPSQNLDYDFIVKIPEGDVGVEIKYDINSMSSNQLQDKFSKLDALCSSGRIIKAIIVSARAPLPEVKRLRTENVSIMPRQGLRDYLSGRPSLNTTKVKPTKPEGDQS